MRALLPHLVSAALALVAVTGAARAETGFVTVDDGVKLFYEREGSGPAIVVPLHLFTYEWLRPLSDKWTVIGYDVRNRGRSQHLETLDTITIQQDVADLETLRRHIGLEKMDLVGHSYTGLMVYLYAAAYPDRVGRIVQLGPIPPVFGAKYRAAYVYTDDVAGEADMAPIYKLRDAGLREKEPERYCLAVWKVLSRMLVGDASHVSRLHDMDKKACKLPNEWPQNFNRHLEHQLPSIQNLVLKREDLGKFQTPVLTIHGTRDRNAAYGGGRDWAYLLPNARLITIEGAAHAAYAERPDIVTPAIRTFLGGHWPTDAIRVTESPLEAG